MANIILDYSSTNIFHNGQNSFRKYTFRDIGTNNIKLINNKIKDINTSNYDKDCIKTALTNLFKFKPGQCILEPEFGNQLYRYIYEPMNKFSQQKIIKTIKSMIQDWQPRIQVQQLPILIDELNQTYFIQIIYIIPLINESDSINVSINKNGTEVV